MHRVTGNRLIVLLAVTLSAISAPAWCQVVVAAPDTDASAKADGADKDGYIYEVIQPKHIGAVALAQLFGGQIISLNADLMGGNYGFGGGGGFGGRGGGYGSIANRGGGWGNSRGNSNGGNWGGGAGGGGNSWGGNGGGWGNSWGGGQPGFGGGFGNGRRQGFGRPF